MCAKQTGQIFYFESERMKFNDTQKKYKRYTTRWITNTFKVPAKKKKTTDNKQKNSKTALEDYEADLGDCSTFPRSTYINSLHNSSPHSLCAMT